MRIYISNRESININHVIEKWLLKSLNGILSFIGLPARMLGADRGNGLASCGGHRGRQRKRASGDKYDRFECAAKAAGGPEHESGENTGARESRHADRRQGRTFLKTAVGGHSVGTDTSPVSLTAEEERIGSSEEEENDDDDRDVDGQPPKKRRRVLERENQARQEGGQVSPEADAAASSPDRRSKRATPPEESPD